GRRHRRPRLGQRRPRRGPRHRPDRDPRGEPAARAGALPRLRGDGPGPAAASPGAARQEGGRGMNRHRSTIAGGVIVLALVAVPLLFSADVANSLGRVLAMALLAVSLDLLVGVSGMPSLGHAAPFGVGAYAAALFTRDVEAFAPVPLLAAVVAGGVLAFVTGIFMVRTKGTYFLMLTLAVAELAHVLAQQWESLTGGTNGLYGIPSITLVPGGEPVTVAAIRYWRLLLVFLLGFAFVWWTARSTFGRGLRGV